MDYRVLAMGYCGEASEIIPLMVGVYFAQLKRLHTKPTLSLMPASDILRPTGLSLECKEKTSVSADVKHFEYYPLTH